MRRRGATVSASLRKLETICGKMSHTSSSQKLRHTTRKFKRAVYIIKEKKMREVMQHFDGQKEIEENQ